MKPLKDLLYKAGTSEVRGSTAVDVASVSFNSAEVKDGDLFVAIRGTRVDGHQFIPMAVAAGASAVVCEEFPTEIKEGVTYVQVADSQLALAQIASNFYDNPSRELELVGITGTNGKTRPLRCFLNCSVTWVIPADSFPPWLIESMMRFKQPLIPLPIHCA